MRRLVLLFLAVATLAVPAAPLAAPITKQNGTASAFTAFTSICAARDGYWRSWYYDCPSGYQPGGSYRDPFAGVTGRLNAVQPKPGVYSLDLTFAGLVPGASYVLWGNVKGTFFAIGTTTADASGGARIGYKYVPGTGDTLGFDLNRDGYTVVTSYWTGATLSVDPATGFLVAS